VIFFAFLSVVGADDALYNIAFVTIVAMFAMFLVVHGKQFSPFSNCYASHLP